MIARPYLLEIDRLDEMIAQLVEIERIEFVGAREMRQRVVPKIGRRSAESISAEESIEYLALNRRKRPFLAHRQPEVVKLFARPLGAAVEEAFRQRHRVHRTGAGSADRIESDAAVF